MQQLSEYEYKKRLYEERIISISEFMNALEQGGNLILENCFNISENIETAIINVINLAGYNVTKDIHSACEKIKERYENDLQQHLSTNDKQQSPVLKQDIQDEKKPKGNEEKGDSGNVEI